MKKDNFITVRVSEEDMSLLDSFCNIYGKSRSEIVREAVTKFFFLNLNRERNPKMIFSKKLQRYFFDHMNDDDLENLAKQSYQMGKQDDIVDKILNPNPEQQDDFQNFKYTLNSLVQNIFPEEAQAWFNKISAEFKEDHVIFVGSHDLGHNFSLFIKYLLEHYASSYNFLIKSEKINEKFVDLRFVAK